VCLCKLCIPRNMTIVRAMTDEISLWDIQSVTRGTDQTSGECSLGQTIPI